ncbi:hypothetical protein HHI36_018885 [Cryptolaemus montrouzieri]|uniref:Maturase K n=1 Tax=Cryptolaemus montrouzieri TaxID=559131 RepID=A0ABD2P1E0_9CUCU
MAQLKEFGSKFILFVEFESTSFVPSENETLVFPFDFLRLIGLIGEFGNSAPSTSETWLRKVVIFFVKSEGLELLLKESIFFLPYLSCRYLSNSSGFIFNHESSSSSRRLFSQL